MKQGMSEKTKIRKLLSSLMESYSIYLVLAGLVLISIILTDSFTDSQNITNIVRQISISTMIAFGAMILIIAGMIDLSAGSVLALAGVLGVMVFVETQSIFLAIIVSVLVGLLCGLIDGLVITKLKVPSFIATMAMQTIARGAVKLMTDAVPIYQIGDLSQIGKGYFLSIPIPVWAMMGVALITWVLLNRTRFGRYIYAIGGNQDAAIAAGVNINLVKIGANVINGIFTGFAGIMLMARLNGGLPLAGVGYEFEAITAAVIGGTSIAGGVGKVAGTIAGALIMGILSNILNLLTVQAYLQEVIKGVIIIIAVAADIVQKEHRERTRKKAHDM